jgi:hypothetical protein
MGSEGSEVPPWERAAIAVFFFVATPLTLLVAAWWGAASLAMYGRLPISDAHIAAFAWGGLALGLALSITRTRIWLQRFYRVPLSLAAIVYAFWSAIATAWFMGLPFGNLLLGACAGAYMGRWVVHNQGTGVTASGAARRAALFASSVTGLAALGIGILAIREPYTLAFARRILGTARFMPDGSADVLLVTAAVAGLLALQYGITWMAARVAAALPGGAGVPRG